MQIWFPWTVSPFLCHTFHFLKKCHASNSSFSCTVLTVLCHSKGLGCSWKAPTQVPTLIFFFKQWSAGWYLLSSEILKKYSLKLYSLSEASLDVVPVSLSKAALLHSLWFSQWAVSSYSGDEVVFASFFCCFFLSEKRKNNGLVFASVSN